MNKSLTITAALLAALNLTACDSSDDDNDATDSGVVYGPLSTGTSSAPVTKYFDLETMQEVVLTEAEAETNTQWDIAFRRTGISLNSHASNSVTTYFTGNNSEFYDSTGTAVRDLFVNATAESELADFEAVTSADIPSDVSMFAGDVTGNAVVGSDFYNYDFNTHAVTPAPENYYIVQSDNTFSKFNATAITAGRNITSITFSIANQTDADAEFQTPFDANIDFIDACNNFDGVYVDLEAGQAVNATDAWDFSLPCVESDGAFVGADLTVTLPSDASAIQDFTNKYTSITASHVSHYGFKTNEYTVKAFDANPWYKYGVDGGHGIWSQFGVYLIQTPTATYKFQMLSYYDNEGTSGSISFRAAEL